MALILQPQAARTALALPTVLHVGSGKNFKPEWLNLDVEERWRPDFVFHLGQPLPPDGVLRVPTERFGELAIGGEQFDAIVAQDVLEHIRDLTTAMTTMLHWLKTGGVLHVGVPYELSLGAWSDPTHVRAFNERSFVYYSAWSWYLGWQTHHFHVQKMEFVPSEFGKQLAAGGVSSEEILRTPRAVDSMQVELVKRELDANGRAAVQHYLQRPLR